MKMLYITGSCLTKNTSANMSHNAFIQGFIENGFEVDILMSGDGWGEFDNALPVWEQASYSIYRSTRVRDGLRKTAKKILSNISSSSDKTAQNTPQTDSNQIKADLNKNNSKLKETAKCLYSTVFPEDSFYPLESAWIKRAGKYKSLIEYDFVVSNSSPAASHKLAQILLRKGNIKAKHWIQIWEDPWYQDLYGKKNESIKKEEHSLLRAAEMVFYVSPLTAEYQKEIFPDCAKKISFIPLPYLKLDEKQNDHKWNQVYDFGYFGDYYSKTRNLNPFYNALRKSSFSGQIYGDSDLSLQSTERITITGRVTLDKLSVAQENTKILVHLCNLHGGQIPGKIYHYSATTKPILFILDGTEEEKKRLKDYFQPYKRYYFVDNYEPDIVSAIKTLTDSRSKRSFDPVVEFSPKEVTTLLIKKASLN